MDAQTLDRRYTNGVLSWQIIIFGRLLISYHGVILLV